MKKNTYNLLIEPAGQNYENLLDYALIECKYFLLVTDRNEQQLMPTVKKLLNELTPYLHKKEMKSEWPGTILIGGKVPVYIFNFVPENAEVLKKAASGLYQWQSPNLPDDLCLLRSDETPWLITTAHEDDSYFILDEDEYYRLVKALPTYASMIEIAKE